MSEIEEKTREWKWARTMKRLCHNQRVSAMRIYKQTGNYEPVRKARSWMNYWHNREAVLSLEIEYLNSKETDNASEESESTTSRGSYADKGTARINI